MGIRMAIGAKPRNILLQVLTAAVALCLVGGVLGILLASAAHIALVAGRLPAL